MYISQILLDSTQKIVVESETLLQNSVHRLKNLISKYVLTISAVKTKMMAIRGDPN